MVRPSISSKGVPESSEGVWRGASSRAMRGREGTTGAVPFSAVGDASSC